MEKDYAQQHKDFATWNALKSRIHAEGKEKLFHAQEMRWCALGANVGVEADGKHSLFERPVIVFRKLNADMFWGLPLTSRKKEHRSYYFHFSILGNEQIALLSQMRVFSTKRLIRRITKISDAEFLALNTQMLSLIHKTDPLRGPRVPNGNNESSVAVEDKKSNPNQGISP